MSYVIRFVKLMIFNPKIERSTTSIPLLLPYHRYPFKNNHIHSEVFGKVNTV